MAGLLGRPSQRRMGIIRQFGATPATPFVLFVSAAATPAHKVPWPPPGLRSSRVFVLLMTSRRSATGTYLFTRSGWSKSHPESTMAMTTVALPWLMYQPSGAPIRLRFHCCGKWASLGVVALLGDWS